MRRIHFFALAAAMAATVQAAPVSPDEALSRAAGNGPARIASRLGSYELKITKQANNTDAVYVFAGAGGNGFIVTPADDCAPAVLGYGDAKIFDENGETAPAFDYWIGEMGRRVEYLSNHPQAVRRVLKAEVQDREPIDVLCATRWNQSSPYNDNCPDIRDQKCVTGCVATAMSQVMKYHNWPEVGNGDINYKWNGKTLKMNFARTLFKWADMLDVYDESSSSDACKAVATLMQAAGYSVHMSYSPSGSGALSRDIAFAMGFYFKYDKSLRYLLRDNFSLSDWEDIIYTSLKTYGPVIYNGQSGIGGHSFVCDGYQSDGYFHFNWGWGGLSDGYFLLDALDPQHQGIGGADGGFDFMQDIIVDIQPDENGDSKWSYQMGGDGLCQLELISGETEDGPSGKHVNYLGLDSAFYNWGPGSVPAVYVGFVYSNLDNPDADPVIIKAYDEDGGDCPVNYGFSSYALEIPQLPDGRYLVTPVYGSGDGEPQDILFPVYGRATSILTIKNGDPEFVSEIVELPELSDMEIPESIDRDEPMSIKGNIQNVNDAPYLCFLSAMLLDDKQETWIAYGMPYVLDFAPGETIELDYQTNIGGLSKLSDGYYYFALTQYMVLSRFAYALDEPQKIYIGTPGSVEKVIDGSLEGNIEIYTSGGVRVAAFKAGETLPELPSGLYIFKSDKDSRKIIIR